MVELLGGKILLQSGTVGGNASRIRYVTKPLPAAVTTSSEENSGV